MAVTTAVNINKEDWRRSGHVVGHTVQFDDVAHGGAENETRSIDYIIYEVCQRFVHQHRDAFWPHRVDLFECTACYENEFTQQSV